jgi:predicted dehydrogenase
MGQRADIGAAVIGVGFIGSVHVETLRRIGVRVAGVLGSTPGRTAARAEALGVEHAYPSLDALCADDSVDVVHVTSPNHAHAEQVLALIAAGKHVVCEKPLALTRADGLRMLAAARGAGVVHAICFNARYYPVVRHARDLVAAGEIGDPRLVTGSYLQDWLLRDTDWSWRLDPEQAGELRSVADIGSHWLDLVRFVTGQDVAEVMADLHTFVPVRRRPAGPVATFASAASDGERVDVPMHSDDAASIMLRFTGGARGLVAVSQVSAGRKNSIGFEVDGSGAALGWNSENADQLWLGHRDAPNGLLWRDPSLLSGEAAGTTHYPGGHAEGFAETFLGLFEQVYADVAAGEPAAEPTYPTFADGCAGLAVEEAVLASHRSRAWARVPQEEDT